MRFLPALAFAAALASRQVLAINDGDILQFALNLECLEAEYYSYAAYGKGIGANLLKRSPADTVGGKQAVTGKFTELAKEIANDEINHVNLLRVAGLDLPCPSIDIGEAFTALARVALNRNDIFFDPYLSRTNFALGAFIFEDVGVTAYNGAIPLIADKDYLAAASGILAIEAYHAGAIRRYLLDRLSHEVHGIEGVTVEQFANAITAIRGAVGGGAETPLTKYISKINVDEFNVASDSNSVAYGRSPSDVLKIVYLGGTSSGGFFPNGLNGPISSA